MNKVRVKKLAKDYLVKVLNYLSKQKLAKYKPYVVGITGNVGKTTTKDYIFTVLKQDDIQVRATQKSFNSEFGVPLTVLGEDNPWDSALGWAKIIFKHFFLNYLKEDYPKVLVLEAGADAPLDIWKITQVVTPNTVVLTAFAENPVHAEFFPDRDTHLREKRYLLDALSQNGVVVFNSDDKDMTVLAESHPTHKKISYGKNSKDVQLINTFIAYDKENFPVGLQIVFVIDNTQYEITLEGVLGNSHTYAVLAAVATGLTFNVDIKTIVESFEKTLLPKSRLRILKGKNNSTLLDDTYNASPKAAILALETLKSIKIEGQKIAILGHMAELGEAGAEEHRKVARLAVHIADKVVLVGRHNDWYLNGLREEKFDPENIFLSNNAEEAIQVIAKNIYLSNTDLVLLKGSQSARIEKVTTALLKNPKDRKQVCRQEEEWQKR
jgi:UDP-N-acetylmuramoyl-tripeptide--D-alanyl-D-alanine ligase